MTGIEAGLVIVTADDPAMHSSQNEQDNRTFAKFARVPCLEPSDSQEAKDLTVAAFELSEQFDTPVLLRLTTRICHSPAPSRLGERDRESAGRAAHRAKLPPQPAKVRHGARQRGQAASGHRGSASGLAEFAETLPVQPDRAGRPRAWASSPAAWPTSTPKRSSRRHRC